MVSFTVKPWLCVYGMKNMYHVQYKTSKEGSTMGVSVSHSAMLAHCHALTQACGYSEGEWDTRAGFGSISNAVLRSAYVLYFILKLHLTRGNILKGYLDNFRF